MSTIQNPGTSLLAQLASPPNISLQLLGTHTTGKQTEVVDFDLWIDCSKKAKIKSGEFLTGNESDHRSWDQSSGCSDSFSKTSSSWLQDWLADSKEGRSWTVRKLVSLRDDDSATIKAHAEGLARKVAYGGSITVKIHTPPLEADVAENVAEVRAEWSFVSPFIPTEQAWDLLVMNAMVDRRTGFISVDEPRPSHGRSPFRRAMKSNNTSTVVSQVQNEEGFKHTVRQYSKWGSDP
ncbi:hypothetical protein N7505_002778 [Penicillium chrysogenum]|uniref:Uncharacterized protein n=1 Tax=Penicillium chrysogenum TaxID=5076 RepID=A0ABQ8WPC8_PENCH|nr:hypothetical protein N7505_002778 [Penicillium chrysogenum]